MTSRTTDNHHTPGPWTVWSSNSWRRIGNPHTSQLVCEPIKQKDGHPDLHFRNGGENGPDAYLIAAAPDLLEALKPLAECEITETDVPLLDSDSARYFITMGEIRAARAAIAKATGADLR